MKDFDRRAYHKERFRMSGRGVVIECIAARLNVPFEVAECALHGFVVYPGKAERRPVDELLELKTARSLPVGEE